MRKLRLAAVGGGAVAEAVHLPALTLSGQAEAAILIDKSLPRAAALAAQFGVPAVAADYREVIGRADAAVVGLPHHLHAEVACDLLRHGLHVLVEKPMALRARDCDAMLEAAAGSGCVLTVGLLRRFSESLRFVKQALDGGLIGKVLSFDLREGGVYGWPVASDAMFRPEAGGVLADAGAHALDLVLW